MGAKIAFTTREKTQNWKGYSWENVLFSGQQSTKSKPTVKAGGFTSGLSPRFSKVMLNILVYLPCIPRVVSGLSSGFKGFKCHPSGQIDDDNSEPQDSPGKHQLSEIRRERKTIKTNHSPPGSPFMPDLQVLVKQSRISLTAMCPSIETGLSIAPPPHNGISQHVSILPEPRQQTFSKNLNSLALKKKKKHLYFYINI